MKQINLVNQCTVKQESLIAVSNGHYCTECQKTVVDYSNMSDAEMLNYISKHGLGCGQFRDDQLDRELILTKTRKKLSFFYYIPILIAFLFKTPNAAAQCRPRPDTTQAPNTSTLLGGKVIMNDKRPEEIVEINMTTTRRFGGAAIVCNKRPIITKHYKRYSLFWGLINFKIRQHK